ncbi:AbrB/MazE/SpoVT family DNA-binding domain-containing protein [Oscillatoria salina]|uniref:AbrB/MazE/SpoVT family DNA-binding domain-containing protein n=1 Tax=Oscillatoria salina TaxID=331517 RepID=UPI0013BB830C|nr:AbrB/MazE/SpoVT family DNA-binding domain-containing protein [Oscillatoria salina]MBZ8181559.1 AbrB/MazE/SpoVT family DNA-binding domain-containing protein [Oscillatoria salina IIICB1]NET89536.1 AbrB/MazE/SpoVT family DNA-binding domain-containing protein [Kamptonema sp. SIO1D9]
MTNYTLKIENEGQLKLPQEVQQQLNLKPGDRLILTVDENGTLHLKSIRPQISKLRGILKDKAPERNLVNELIYERHQEAMNE